MDFTLWHQLLQQYVDPQGRINYRGWQAEAWEPFRQWLRAIALLEPLPPPHPGQDPSIPLATWINLYNALVIATILQRYPLTSVFPHPLGIPHLPALFSFFKGRRHDIARGRYSLDDIEHGILRRHFTEPRIHFALVCGARGCPLLRPEAYTPERVLVQLEEDARRFILNPAKVQYDSAAQTLRCSRIFQWYRPDFLKVAPSLTDYLRPYLSFLPAQPRIAFLPYDWGLNDQNHPLGDRP